MQVNDIWKEKFKDIEVGDKLYCLLSDKTFIVHSWDFETEDSNIVVQYMGKMVDVHPGEVDFEKW